MNDASAEAALVEPQSVSNPLARMLGAALMVGIALIHYLDLGGKMAEVPYLGYMYIALIAGSLLAAVLLFTRARVGWTLGGLLALATFLGYCVNRIVGMPNAMDDIGNWGEPLGVVSLGVEGAMVLLSAGMLRLRQVARTTRSY